MAAAHRYELRKDTRGTVWDLLLYVPTVVALGSIGLHFWYGGQRGLAYLLYFLACFFTLVGANRVLARLLVLPGAPVALELDKREVRLRLKSGQEVRLVAEVRYFPDYAGKSFGLTGIDQEGRKRQFVLHRGQFADPSAFEDLRSRLEVYR